MSENANKRAVSFDDFAEASKLIATKTEVQAVKDQVDGIQVGNGVVFASTEEILALFKDGTQGDAESGPESGSGSDIEGGSQDDTQPSYNPDAE